MRVKTLQIAWHERQPVFSCDFHPSGQLVTCGADHEIKVWQVSEAADGSPAVTYVGSLLNHTKAVNCVRFHPQGTCLASAGDGGEVMLWRPPQGADDVQGVEQWKATNPLRGHSDDVLDVSWAQDGSGLVSSSIEHTIIVWDQEAAKKKQTYTKHKHYVQGVAWDPLGDSIVSQSLDRSIKVMGASAHKRRRKAAQTDLARTADFSVLATVYKRIPTDGAVAAVPPTPGRPADGAAVGGDRGSEEAPAGGPRAEYIFNDESMSTFFRRLAFSPDGSLLVAPAASLGSMAQAAKCANAAVVFARHNLAAPCAVLPSLASGSTCVRFCPVFFQSAHAAPPPGRDVLSVCDPHPPSSGAHQNDANRRPGSAAASGGAAGEAPGSLQGAGGEGGPGVDENGHSGDGGEGGRLSRLPYKLVFAVGCTDSVFIYDTDSEEPLAVLGAIHFKHVTDLAWSADGLRLAATSHDGYCTLATFRRGELGEPLPAAAVPDIAALKAEISQRMAPAVKKRRKSSSKPTPNAAAEPTLPGQSQPGLQGPTADGPHLVSPSAGETNQIGSRVTAESPHSLPAPAASAGVKRRLAPQAVASDGAEEVTAAAAPAAAPSAKRRLDPQAVADDAQPPAAPGGGAEDAVHRRAGCTDKSATERVNEAETPAAANMVTAIQSGVVDTGAREPSSRQGASAEQSERLGSSGEVGRVVCAEPAFVRGVAEELVALPDEAAVKPRRGFSLALLAAQAGATAACDDDSD